MMKTNHTEIGLALATALLVALPAPILAQEGAVEAAPSISVEINSTLQLESACQLTFMLTNGLEADVDSLVFETVLLNTEGAVDRLTLFDMRDLPSGTPRVRQFNVPALACEDLGQILINGVAECAPEGCADALTYSSRIEVEILG
jgi:hypothetical protein